MKSVWEDLVNDVLETQCQLPEQERALPLAELRKAGVLADYVELHPAFSVDGLMVIVLEKRGPKQCWLYFPKQKNIKKITLR